MEMGTLLPLLVESMVLGLMHWSHIVNPINDTYKQRREFLSILRRRSFTQYQQFIHCLQQDDQPRICEALLSDGGIHFKLK